jgi:hypothetical protein
MWLNNSKTSAPYGYGRLMKGSREEESAYIASLISAEIHNAEVTVEECQKIVFEPRRNWLVRLVRKARSFRKSFAEKLTQYVMWRAPDWLIDRIYGHEAAYADRMKIGNRLRDSFRKEGITEDSLAGTFQALSEEPVFSDYGKEWVNPFDIEEGDELTLDYAAWKWHREAHMKS